jgi:hypothetical protein
MSRVLACLIALGVFGLTGRADEKGTNPETLIRLDVTPAPEPVPALRYQLLPEIAEMNPGNPIMNYFKCCMEQQAFFFDKEALRRREELLAMPLKELPAQDMQEYGRSALSRADWAARLDNPDWQILLKLKTDGVSLLLPDVQQLRGLARALQVRFRSEVALGHFDDAIRTAKTMFALSRHMSEHPTLIGNLVGIAIASITIATLEEMLKQPDCPNLYWALTNLPHPLVPLTKGIDGERVIVLTEFRDLDDRGPMSADQLKKFVARMDMLIEAADSAKGVRAFLDARTRDATVVEAARGRLIARGLPRERVLTFPAEQVILLDEKREYLVRRDDETKIMALPVWQAQAMQARDKAKKPPAVFADALLPFTKTVLNAQGRLDQKIALLRHVEALRLHAAEHGGKLPAGLSEIAVPLPDDPFTGKPFRYALIGTTAHIRGTPPAGLEKEAAFNLHYEVSLQK